MTEKPEIDPERLSAVIQKGKEGIDLHKKWLKNPKKRSRNR